jgi:hypothetical protein
MALELADLPLPAQLLLTPLLRHDRGQPLLVGGDRIHEAFLYAMTNRNRNVVVVGSGLEAVRSALLLFEAPELRPLVRSLSSTQIRLSSGSFIYGVGLDAKLLGLVPHYIVWLG